MLLDIVLLHVRYISGLHRLRRGYQEYSTDQRYAVTHGQFPVRVGSGLPHNVRGQPCHQQKTGQFQVQVYAAMGVWWEGGGSVGSGLPHNVRGQPCHQQKTGQFQVQVYVAMGGGERGVGDRAGSGLPHTVRGQPCHQQKTGQFSLRSAGA